jgi:DNA ligase-1
MKPMLAVNIKPEEVRFPVIASPKIDGVRGLVIDGKLVGRSLKSIPNRYVNDRFGRSKLSGVDGELVVGSPVAKDVFRVTQGALARAEFQPDVTFLVFDCFDAPGGYAQRLEVLKARVFGVPGVVVLEQRLIWNAQELIDFESQVLALGFEGLILRSPNGAYKHGRSTAGEQGMLKLKRFVDSEAVILDVVEELHNRNAAVRRADGKLERGTAKAGKTGKGRMGALVVRDIASGVEFNVGTGFNDTDREYFYRNAAAVRGKIIKYKSFPVGDYSAPRFPVYLGGREAWDMGE